MTSVRRVTFLGNPFWLWFWAILFFPVGLFYFLMHSMVVRGEVEDNETVEWFRATEPPAYDD